MGDAVVQVDLFGDVRTLPSGRRGRPAHCWSKSASETVILGLAMGYKPAEIAGGLGISLPTLRKHYFSELKAAEMQRARVELWRARTLAKLAGEGNVAAMNALTKVIEKRDRRIADEAIRRAQAGAEHPKGKKEAARDRAASIAAGNGEGWGDLLAPGGKKDMH